MESNDSPEIPDRGETSDIPGLPSGEMVSNNCIEGIAWSVLASIAFGIMLMV